MDSKLPVSVNLLNVGSVTEHLYNGHNTALGQKESVSIYPHRTKPAKVAYEFITWAPLPATLKVLSYEMNDGQVLLVWPPKEVG